MHNKMDRSTVNKIMAARKIEHGKRVAERKLFAKALVYWREKMRYTRAEICKVIYGDSSIESMRRYYAIERGDVEIRPVQLWAISVTLSLLPTLILKTAFEDYDENAV